MNRADIEIHFNHFFEFETDDRRTVTSVSCRLFAEALVKMEREACANICKKLAHEYQGRTSLNEYNQTYNEGRASGAEMCASLIEGRGKA